MASHRSILAGIIAIALLTAGAAITLRPSGEAGVRDAGVPDAGSPGAGAAHRGGQLIASARGEPRSFNRLVVRDLTSSIVSGLMQGGLVRINPSTFELEPWLAERWESSPDGRTHVVHLREGVTWSDGAPVTSADVVFSLRAVFDPTVSSVLADALTVAGQPIRAEAPDPQTVVLTFAGPSGPGMRILDNLTILPRHKIEGALAGGTFASAWDTRTPPSDIVGTGPFVLRDYQPGQRLVFERNPRYWRKAPDGQSLPFLDRLVLEVVPEQNAEIIRLQSGATHLTHTDLRAEDYLVARQGQAQGRLTMIELGVSPDADAFWFCLKPEARKTDPRFAFVQKPEFRQAMSHAVDRQAFVDTVYLGAGVPIWGPVTPGNRRWFWRDVPRYPHDVTRAKALLQGIGLKDRDGDGVVEDEAGTEARFSVITQRGFSSYERGSVVLQDNLQKIGVEVEFAPLEIGAMIQRMLACDYDAVYYRPLLTDLDPAGNMDFWLSSGSAHFWNLEQKTPATDWERQVDRLMLEQAATLDPERRRQQFNEVQRILAENLPVLYFAAPIMTAAHSARVRGVVPSILRPPILWNADSLSIAP